ncbi:MAG: efflux RND transporter permease subunit [Proteobacteria bacterium]|nr:efflux RND transporter permease subunit [Pseudomonadota bacterium]MBU1711331.1 efflux RND transporter permease subunit [Pseudomonadota bacterium]
MNGAISWMARNHVAANLLMFLFIVGGLVMSTSVKQEVFPEINLDRIQVTVVYPGASPEEVEEGIILKIEESISGVDGIKELLSVAAEGVGNVTAVINTGEDADQVLEDIKGEIDRITTFPEDAERPVVAKMVTRREVISLVVYGNVPERTLREQAEAMRDELLAMKQITQADLNGVRPYEISIEIPEENLRRFNLTLDMVAQIVHGASMDLPGGSIKSEGGEILIRTKERRYTGAGYGDITILVDSDGTMVKLKDIAEIKDTFAETDTFANFDGYPAAMVAVFRVGDQKPTEISNIVAEYARKKQETLPESIMLSTWNDTSEIYQSRLNLLLKNAFLGLILVFVILSLSLHMKLALWVMLGIPISFLGALLIMPMADVSINMISLFAFIMALGVVVDDAIVVGENIYEHRQQGKTHLQAAIDGAREVAVPVTFSILTSVAAFVPLMFIVGTMGKFIKVIPFVVISILLVSLVESLFVLPAHLSLGREKPSSPDKDKKPAKAGNGFARRLEKFINGPYHWLLTHCVRHRYVNVALAIAMLMFSIGLIKGGIVKFRFMPNVEADWILVEIEMPQGSLKEDTAKVQQFIVEQGNETVAHFDAQLPEDDTVLRHIYSVVGGTIARGGPGGGSSSSAPHLANVSMLLAPGDKRDISTYDISNYWRDKVGEIPGVDTLSFSSSLVHMGANIDVRLAHENYEVLVKATSRLKEVLGEYPGVYDIVDTYPEGKRELKIRLKPEARTLGITENALARQIRSAFYGAEALRLQRGRNEVKVMVRYPESERTSQWDFDTMRIRTPQGGEVPLHQAAYVEEGRGFSVINRSDRKRVINVSASVDNKTANAEEIINDLKGKTLAELMMDYPGLSYDLEGEEKERRESMGSMMKGFVMALLVMYALLAIPFRSYSQPLLIMAAIPFGIVGAVLGHLIMGFDLSMLSLFGIVALSGVVVNDSLLLIDRVNQSRRKGASLKEAVVEAGLRRFRPIMLTSFTTFFGLMPMILEKSVQAQFLIPMAISLGFGIMFATMITLLLIPSLYLVLEDVRNLFGMKATHHRFDHQDH